MTDFNSETFLREQIDAVGEKIEGTIQAWRESETDKRTELEGAIADLQEKQSAIEERLKSAERLHLPGVEIGMSGEKEKFSFGRAMKLITGVCRMTDPEVGYEAEVFKSMEGRYDGLEIEMKTAINAATDSGGAFLIPTEVMEDLIPELEASSIAAALGVSRLDGLSGNLSFTKDAGGITAAYIDSEAEETGAESVPTFSSIELRPHVLAAFVPMTWSMLTQPALALEAWVRNRMATKIALRKDKSIFLGDSSNSEPRGILNTAGLATVTWAAMDGSEDWSGSGQLVSGLLVDMVAALAENDVDVTGKSLGWALEPALMTSLSKTKDGDGNPIFIGPNDPRMSNLMGYTGKESSQLVGSSSDRTLIFGDFSKVIDANWGTMAFASSDQTETNFRKLRTTVRAVMAHDVGILEPSAFVEATNLDDSDAA
jgi:HK97 family phage major capsid protein